MSTLKSILMAIWGVICFIGGLFVYAKLLDKPETVVNNEYGKVKTKGRDNATSTDNHQVVNVVNVENKKDKKKFRIFKRKKK